MATLYIFRNADGSQAQVDDECRTGCIESDEGCSACLPVRIAVEVEIESSSADEGITEFSARVGGKKFDLTTDEGTQAVELLNPELEGDGDFCRAVARSETAKWRDSYR